MTDSRTTIPAGLFNYGVTRGYSGVPSLVEAVHGGHWIAASGPATVENIAALAKQRATRIAVQWRDSGPADFALTELTPWTGLRGNPDSFSVTV
jgi:hypothetical protein